MRKQKWFRVFSALILTLSMVLGSILNGVGTIGAEAAETIGKAKITPGTAISYGGWSTNRFSVKAADGETYLGYCAQPLSATPSGTYSYRVYDGKNANEIKLMAYIGWGTSYAATDARNNLFAGIPNETTRYGYIHAVIGYLYSGQLTGLNAGTIEGVKNITAGLRSLISTNHIVWTQAKKMTLYVAPNNAQDIVWVGYGNGAIQLTKQAATNIFSEFSDVYSLEGAEYGIYKDAECTQELKVLTCDADGVFPKVEVDYGTYYIKEIQAPKGFALSAKIKKVTVAAGSTETVKLTDQPQGDPVPVLLEKSNAQTGDASGWGECSLAGAEYTYDYYAVPREMWSAWSSEEKEARIPDRTWVFRTDAGGHIQVSDKQAIEQYLVSGDLFYDTSGNLIYPIGTYVIRETREPVGFLLNEEQYTVFIEEDAQAVTDEDGNEVYFIHTYNEGDAAVRTAERPIRGNLAFVKADAETEEVMAGIPFELSLLGSDGEPVETQTVLTDENGEVHTGLAGSEIWFGPGSPAPGTEGALPYGTYRLTELPCESNAGKDLLELEVDVHEPDVTLALGTLYNQTIYIHTLAGCTETGTHTVPAGGRYELQDQVAYRNLTPGRTYVMEGCLVDKHTGEAIVIDGTEVRNSAEFVPEEADGTVTLTFTIDTDSLEQGAGYVVYEKLYDRESKRASHEDPEDEEQSIYIPKIRTHASDQKTHDHVGTSCEETVIVDHVEYRGLAAGETYTVSGVLMDQDQEAPWINDRGETVQAEHTFTAQGCDGTIELEFMVSEEAASGKTLTVFETLYQNGIRLAAHEDLYDEEQSVAFPKIRTHAEDGTLKDQDHVGVTGEKVTIVDTVTYENLIPGNTYTVHGTLMNRETGEEILDEEGIPVTAERTWEATEADGSIELTFELDSYLLAGETVVVYEDLQHNEIPVAVHHELQDESQSIHYPALGTMAKSEANGTQTLPVGPDTVLIDTVEYKNLVPGKTYRLKGVLMDRETVEPLPDKEGEPVAAEAEFVPDAPDGTVDMEFVLDTSALAGKKLVVFEKLFLVSGGNETDMIQIGQHEDITDEGQTVGVPELRTQAMDQASKTQEGTFSETEKIVDTVSYKGLTPGKTYTVKGILMDKRKKEPLLINGEEITSEQTFVPTERDGQVLMEFTLDSRDLHGRTIVVFESVWQEDLEIAVHADMKDEDQSIHYKKKKIIGIKTGDSAYSMGWLILLLLSAAAAAAGSVVMVRIYRRRRRGV